jgi:hypothetical protein
MGTSRHAASWSRILLLAAPLAASWPLLAWRGLPCGDDVLFTMQWAYGFVGALREGVAYPRWIAESNGGLGGPIFIFYAPLGYLAVGAAHVLTGDVVSAVQVVLAVAALLSGLTFYLAARELGSRSGAAVGAALYVLLPYRVLDVYWRFAFAESCAFVWFPLVFLYVRRLAREPTAGAAALLALAYAGLLLTHLVTAFMTLLLLAPYALMHLACRPGRVKRLGVLLASGVLALLLSAVYLVPLLAQREAVYLDSVYNPALDWSRSFLFQRPQSAGSNAGRIRPWVETIALAQAAIALGAAGLLALRRRGASMAAKGSGSQTEGWIQALLCAWATFLQIPASAALWANLPELGSVQFPWRFSAFQGLSACVLVSCAWSAERGAAAAPAARLPAMARRLSAAAMRAALVLAVVAALELAWRIPGARGWIQDGALRQGQRYRDAFVYEYLPRGLPLSLLLKPEALKMRRAELSGPGSVHVLLWHGHTRRLLVEGREANRLRLRTLAYPGWRAYVDGQPVPLEAGHTLQLIELRVAPGRRQVLLRFEPTADRWLGAVLSGAGLTLLAALGLAARPRRPPLGGHAPGRLSPSSSSP